VRLVLVVRVVWSPLSRITGSAPTPDLDAEFLESQLRVTESEVNALHAQLVAREHKLQQQAEFARQAQARAAQLQLPLPGSQRQIAVGTGVRAATVSGESLTASETISQVAAGAGPTSKSYHSPPILTSVPARPRTSIPFPTTSVAPVSTSVARPQSSSAVSVSFASSSTSSSSTNSQPEGPTSPMEHQRAQQLLKLQQHLHAGEERPITATSTTSTSSSTSSVSVLPHRPLSSDASRWQPTLSTVMSAPSLPSPAVSSVHPHHAAPSGLTRGADEALVDGSVYNVETDEYDNDIEDDDGEDDNDEDDDLVFYPASQSQRLHPPQSQPPQLLQPSHPPRQRQEGQERPEEEEDSELSDSEPLYPPYKPKYKYTPLQIESRYIEPTGFAWSKVKMNFPEPKLKKPTNVVKKKPLAKWEKKLVKRLVRVSSMLCCRFP
jgi:hypothetical protein